MYSKDNPLCIINNMFGYKKRTEENPTVHNSTIDKKKKVKRKMSCK